MQLSYDFAKFQQKSLEILTFTMTFASMMLGLSLIPLFPQIQPLPIILSFLIAFATFKNPKYGMSIGSLLIGLGLIYHLSRINFILILGGPGIRLLAILALLFLFASLPSGVHRHEDAITIAVGIIAATSLFFGQTYYFAVPLILIFTVLYKKARLGLTLSYYVLISIPLQIMQYLKYIFNVDPIARPPLYVPLTEIFKDMQESMSQVSFSEMFKVIETIARQVILEPDPMMRAMEKALSTYANSFPGMVLFLIILSGLISAAAFITLNMLKVLEDVEVVKRYARYVEMFLPAITAAGTTALFFLLISGLQDPLAFKAEIDASKMAIGTLATVLVTTPASLVNYMLKLRAAIEMRSEMLMKKSQDLLTRLQTFEELLNKVKSCVPIVVSSIEGKMLLIKDKLNDILSKASARFYDSSELNEKFDELDKGISNEINNLMPELNVSLEEYHTHANYEYSTWVTKFKDIGLEVETTAETVFQKELPLETRIDLIGKVLEAGRLLANEFIQVLEQIYDIIRSLYDPKLPEESPTVTFARQKLDENIAPWIAMDALFTSLHNLEKQYGAEISRSVEHLQSSLTSIVNLSTQSEGLLPVLGSNLPKMMDYAKKAEDIKIEFEKKALNVMKVMIIRDALQSSLSIARDVLSIFYEELKGKEESIESLLPTKDYGWEKNVTLKERIASTMEIISNPSKYELDQVIGNLYKSLSYVDECVGTIDIYNEKNEFLLNYPIAELAIEDLLRQKKHIYAQDLPFEPKYAEEYLRLFYRQRYREFSLDETNMLLMRKA